MDAAISVFKSLSDLNRIRILKMLLVRPLCVCEIRDVLKLANSTVSKHLKLLKEAGLILDEKDGKWVNYKLNTNLNSEYVRHLLPLIQSWFQNEDIIKSDQLKVEKVDRNKLCNI